MDVYKIGPVLTTEITSIHSLGAKLPPNDFSLL